MSNKDLLENIKKLRELTGVGFKDCKNAIDENGGDIEKSIEFLRKKGIAKASKKMNRTASEGLALVKELLGPIIKNPDDMDLLNQFEGYCFTNFHRYVLDTQRVLYNVSQGRFYDKTDIPKDKWKDSWSKKTYLW